MKLILKRYGEKPEGLDGRPFALHTEDGEILPCQVSTSLNSSHSEYPTVTVVFQAVGDQLIIEGDEK